MKDKEKLQMESQPTSQTPSDNPEAEAIAELENQLREAAAADNFFETATGRIAVEIATKEINLLVRQICSDKFLKDHMGYVNALAQLTARKDWLKKLQLAASPMRVAKINEKLENLQNG